MNTENKIREKLNLTKEEAIEILEEDSEEYKIIEDKICGMSRWSIRHLIIIQRISDGKYFCDRYSVGATELQDEGPYEYSDPKFSEVFPIQKTITAYE